MYGHTPLERVGMPVYQGSHLEHLQLFIRTPTGQIALVLLVLLAFLAMFMIGLATLTGSAVGGAFSWFVARRLPPSGLSRATEHSIERRGAEQHRVRMMRKLERDAEEQV